MLYLHSSEDGVSHDHSLIHCIWLLHCSIFHLRKEKVHKQSYMLENSQFELQFDMLLITINKTNRQRPNAIKIKYCTIEASTHSETDCLVIYELYRFFGNDSQLPWLNALFGKLPRRITLRFRKKLISHSIQKSKHEKIKEFPQRSRYSHFGHTQSKLQQKWKETVNTNRPN